MVQGRIKNPALLFLMTRKNRLTPHEQSYLAVMLNMTDYVDGFPRTVHHWPLFYSV